jgi:hypothetical protein
MRLGGARQYQLAPQYGKNGEVSSGVKDGRLLLMLLIPVPAAAVAKHQ